MAIIYEGPVNQPPPPQKPWWQQPQTQQVGGGQQQAQTNWNAFWHAIGQNVTGNNPAMQQVNPYGVQPGQQNPMQIPGAQNLLQNMPQNLKPNPAALVDTGTPKPMWSTLTTAQRQQQLAQGVEPTMYKYPNVMAATNQYGQPSALTGTTIPNANTPQPFKTPQTTNYTFTSPNAKPFQTPQTTNYGSGYQGRVQGQAQVDLFKAKEVQPGDNNYQFKSVNELMSTMTKLGYKWDGHQWLKVATASSSYGYGGYGYRGYGGWGGYGGGGGYYGGGYGSYAAQKPQWYMNMANWVVGK